MAFCHCKSKYLPPFYQIFSQKTYVFGYSSVKMLFKNIISMMATGIGVPNVNIHNKEKRVSLAAVPFFFVANT